MKIIPAIDILGGKCVRLSQGDYAKVNVYDENPVEVAKRFEDAGLRYLHLVDLDGARCGKITNADVLQKIASTTDLHIDFGGGIKSEEDIRLAFGSGARQVTAGSVAVKSPEIVADWLGRFGPEKIILGADCRNRRIATDGWLQESGIDVLDFVSGYAQKGARTFICTDISKDGMLEGASIELYAELLSKLEIDLVASGGVGAISDLERLKAIGCAGVIIGKALYENRISLKQLTRLC